MTTCSAKVTSYPPTAPVSTGTSLQTSASDRVSSHEDRTCQKLSSSAIRASAWMRVGSPPPPCAPILHRKNFSTRQAADTVSGTPSALENRALNAVGLEGKKCGSPPVRFLSNESSASSHSILPAISTAVPSDLSARSLPEVNAADLTHGRRPQQPEFVRRVVRRVVEPPTNQAFHGSGHMSPQPKQSDGLWQEACGKEILRQCTGTSQAVLVLTETVNELQQEMACLRQENQALKMVVLRRDYQRGSCSPTSGSYDAMSLSESTDHYPSTCGASHFVSSHDCSPRKLSNQDSETAQLQTLDNCQASSGHQARWPAGLRVRESQADVSESPNDSEEEVTRTAGVTQDSQSESKTTVGRPTDDPTESFGKLQRPFKRQPTWPSALPVKAKSADVSDYQDESSQKAGKVQDNGTGSAALHGIQPDGPSQPDGNKKSLARRRPNWSSGLQVETSRSDTDTYPCEFKQKKTARVQDPGADVELHVDLASPLTSHILRSKSGRRHTSVLEAAHFERLYDVDWSTTLQDLAPTSPVILSRKMSSGTSKTSPRSRSAPVTPTHGLSWR